MAQLASGNAISDTSDGTFCISGSNAYPYLDVKWPNGGEVLSREQGYSIAFVNQGAVTIKKIWLVDATGSGSSYRHVIKEGSLGTIDEWSWQVPKEFPVSPSGRYKIYVEGVGQGGQVLGATSDQPFDIVVVSPPEPRVISSEPKSGYTDARQPTRTTGDRVGWDQITLVFDQSIGGKSKSDFFVSTDSTSKPVISEFIVDPSDPRRLTIKLDRPIVPGYGTVIGPIWGGAICLNYLPGDVNEDGKVSALDQIALIDHLNGVEGKVRPLHQADIDRSGTVTAQDITRLIDLFNQGWLGRELVGCAQG
ncbi:MAG: dockerin type I domain-containing protein [Patescibacteria group bacterium]